MFENYLLIDNKRRIEEVFSAQFSYDYKPLPCISKRDIAPVIVQGNPRNILPLQFGMPPSLANEKLEIVNARAEGKANKQNLTNKIFPKDIKNNRYFAKPMRYKRCIIPASALLFCGGVQYDYDWFITHFINKDYRPFAIAGIWDQWVNQNTGEGHSGFCIITVAASRISSKLGQGRSPLILSKREIGKWLDSNTELGRVTNLMEPNFEEEDAMNAYPIDKTLLKVKNPDFDLLKPIGPKLYKEQKRYEYK